ncbi:hypothetical protein [Embleya sp. AB8]|uniref:hypothetical protein n=1 Tax=Embleya sp. AB8 TaxID=3156304 RepID=UPI003C78BA7A
MRVKGLGVAAVVGVSLAVLSGCGNGRSPLSTVDKVSPTPVASGDRGGSGLDENVKNEDLDVGELVRRAKQSATKIKTVHVVADITAKGKVTRLDLRVDRGSEDFQGRIEQDGVKLDVRRIGSAMYVQGDEQAFRSLVGGAVDGDFAAKLLAGKWLRGDVNSAKLGGIRGITTVADPGAALKDFPENGIKLPVETINNRKMIPLTGPPGQDDGKVYIEAQGGKPYPVLIVSQGATNTGSISYGDFDVPVTVTAPAPGDVVDIPDRSSSSATPRPGTTA